MVGLPSTLLRLGFRREMFKIGLREGFSPQMSPPHVRGRQDHEIYPEQVWDPGGFQSDSSHDVRALALRTRDSLNSGLHNSMNRYAKFLK